jgi:hypothetical protein
MRWLKNFLMEFRPMPGRMGLNYISGSGSSRAYRGTAISYALRRRITYLRYNQRSLMGDARSVDKETIVVNRLNIARVQNYRGSSNEV